MGAETRSLAAFAEALQDFFSHMERIGSSGFPCSESAVDLLRGWGKTPPRIATLQDVRAELGDCRRCGLCSSRQQIVFGAGSPKTDLVFVGEGPGFEEDRQGVPFVGPAGDLLTKIIHAIGKTRDAIYIANVVKCRPPGNRNPNPEEVSACLPFLKRQLAVIQPKIVCALGAVAARALLETEEPISRLRGRFHRYGDARLMPTYHPAYLLRNPEKKRDVWEDMKKIMAELGLPLPR